MYKSRRFKNKRAIPGLFILLSFFVIALFAPWIAPFDLKILKSPFLPPSLVHILGTNDIGQDILSELIFGARISLLVGMAAAILATTFGALIGMVSGFFRGITDDILMRFTDIFLLIPGLPLIIILSAYLGPGTGIIIIAIAFLAWPSTARVVRSRVLQVREASFIMSAKGLGAGNLYIIFRHILPNTIEVVFAKASLAVAGAMLTEAGVSFLGLGDPTRKSWGMMLHDAFSNGGVVNGCFWWYLPPVFCISLAVLGFTLSGYAYGERKEGEGLLLPAGMKDLKHHASEAGSAGTACLSESDLLSVRGLGVKFRNDGRTIQALDKIDLSIKEREKVAIVGETGSGKSVLLLALLRLLPANAQISGRIYYKGKDILKLGDDGMRQIRGSEIAYVPQGAGNALNPVLKIGFQVAEPLRVHSGLKKAPALKRAVILLDKMGIEKAEKRVSDYPHQYSGGMKERALVAMALAGEADLILADEPVKGLDWGKREEILRIFQGLNSKTILTITHDLWFAERFAQRVVVIYASKIVEVAPQETFFVRPLHPYSRALLAAQPSRGLHVQSGYATIMAENIESGCPFRLHCNAAFQKCREEPPLFKQNGHEIRCWRYAA